MLKSLKIKFISITMALVAIIIIFVFTLIFQSNVMSLYDRSISDLKHISSLSFIDIANDNFEQELKKWKLTPFFIVNINEEGIITSSIKSNIEVDESSLGEAVYEAYEDEKNIGTIDYYNVRYYKTQNGNHIKIAFIDISRDEKTIESLFFILLLTGTFTLTMFFIIILFLSTWALRPVEKAWNSQKQFIADASHELKTPLTVLLANMDILDDNKEETIKSQIKWINASRQEALQMKNLIEEMLFLAKSDANKINNTMMKINISDILISQILSLEVIAFEKNVTINYDEVDEDIYINANEKQIISLLSILLENACKYSDINTIITVRLKKENDKVKFDINNMGPVIPKSELPHIFERFYRVEKSRNKNHGGYGLGLSIAKKIVDEHNMKISVESNETKGTTFKIIMNEVK